MIHFCLILYNLYATNTTYWSRELSPSSEFTAKILQLFNKVILCKDTLENARDFVRKMLFNYNPINFPMGQSTAASADIIDIFMGETSYGSINYKCDTCSYEGRGLALSGMTVLIANDDVPRSTNTIAKFLDLGRNSELSGKLCKECVRRNRPEKYYTASQTITKNPQFIAFELVHQTHIIKPNIKLDWHGPDGKNTLILCGLIYGGQSHFVSRIIDRSGRVWYHDGASTGPSMMEERAITMIDDTDWLLKTPCGRTLIACMYRNKAVGAG